jgi:ankyrin repeat protein
LPPDLYKNFFLFRQQEGGYTALHLAAQKGSSQSIQSLVNATKDLLPEFISAVDHYGQTALHWAASQGNGAASTSFCEVMKPEDINIQATISQQTALHFAVQGGHLDVVRLLIAKGADVDLKDVEGRTALNWAQNHLSAETKEAMISLLTVNT